MNVALYTGLHVNIFSGMIQKENSSSLKLKSSVDYLQYSVCEFYQDTDDQLRQNVWQLQLKPQISIHK